MYVEDRMAFPTTNLGLKEVCEAYGITTAPYSMSALRGKKYYSSTGVETTIPATGSIVLGDFRGKTSTPLSSTYNLDIPTTSKSFDINTDILYFNATGTDSTYTISYGILTSMYLNRLFMSSGLYSPNYNIGTLRITFVRRNPYYYFESVLDSSYDNVFNHIFPTTTLTNAQRIDYIRFDFKLTTSSGNSFYYYSFQLNVTTTGLVLDVSVGGTIGTYNT
jgi:hypothetical protein